MTYTSGHCSLGRLGNQFIRNLAVSLIAEKHDLHVLYCNNHLFERLGIHLFSGKKFYNSIKVINEENYFSIYNDNINYNLNPNTAFFQTKEITNLIYKYLHSEQIKKRIIGKNPFNSRYSNNNDLFVHIRLTDVTDKNPGINYYSNAIKRINFDKLYIATDDKTHNIITDLIMLYPSLIIVDLDEINTFQFGSTCKNIVLSHGTFSMVIGYLAFFSTVYYPEFNPDKLWHGDVFSIENWIKLPTLTALSTN